MCTRSLSPLATVERFPLSVSTFFCQPTTKKRKRNNLCSDSIPWSVRNLHVSHSSGHTFLRILASSDCSLLSFLFLRSLRKLLIRYKVT